MPLPHGSPVVSFSLPFTEMLEIIFYVHNTCQFTKHVYVNYSFWDWQQPCQNDLHFSDEQTKDQRGLEKGPGKGDRHLFVPGAMFFLLHRANGTACSSSKKEGWWDFSSFQGKMWRCDFLGQCPVLDSNHWRAFLTVWLSDQLGGAGVPWKRSIWGRMDLSPPLPRAETLHIIPAQMGSWCTGLDLILFSYPAASVQKAAGASSRKHLSLNYTLKL